VASNKSSLGGSNWGTNLKSAQNDSAVSESGMFLSEDPKSDIAFQI